MLGPSFKEIEEKTKNNNTKNFKNLPIDKLLKNLNDIEQAKIYDDKTTSEDRLLRIINNNNKENRNSIFKSKRLYELARDSLFKLKRNKFKRSLYAPSKKTLFKAKIKEIRKILYK